MALSLRLYLAAQKASDGPAADGAEQMRKTGRMMNIARALVLCAFGSVCSTQALHAQSLSSYRAFDLGSNLAAVSSATGVAPSAAKTVHQRPALLQDLEWRPSRWGTGANATDPVERISFSFYNDQLFRIVVDYSHDRTEGMTQADMIEALAAVYGAVLPKTTRAGRVASQVETESGAPFARWADAEYSVVLYQTSSYRPTFRVIVTDGPRAELARKADGDAQRLDVQEAPQREVARQNKDRADQEAAAAKARSTNKDVFQP
jgi:hypothetical protein